MKLNISEVPDTFMKDGNVYTRGEDMEGQVLYYTGIYQWKDRTFHDKPQEDCGGLRESPVKLEPTLDELEATFRRDDSYACPHCGKRGGH